MTDKLQNRTALDPLFQNGWTLVGGRDAIQKTFQFKSFRAAFAWMTEMALWAEKLDHHPEWANVYGRVDVILTTHSCDGVSDLDIKLATKMDKQ